MGILTPLDLTIFFGSLIAVMIAGLWAGRGEATSQDFYLAGKTARWWGVTGSIFGTNISANHIVGMMGVGFSIGFAQSHFEITAIAGLLLLCYGFLPVYRKLNVYTLSEYLSRRYDDRSRVAYAILMVISLVVIQIVPGFYIGSRSLNILLTDEGQLRQAIDASPVPGVESSTQSLDDQEHVQDATVRSQPKKRVLISRFNYVLGILIMVAVTGTYTIVGGLKAVIITDVIQSAMMLLGVILVAVMTFVQPEVGGWTGMRALDMAQSGGRDMMHLYLPTNHPKLPWSGVLTGLMIMHFHYWGTNQFIVQRALAARTDKEARLGIIVAGFLKLLIPFFSVGTGIAAYYLFARRLPGVVLDQDTAFPMLIRHAVSPLGFGVVGIVAAGLIGAILSSIDSMMNSAATIVTFDFYRRYVHPTASERRLVLVGRLCIVVFFAGAALLTIFTMDPNSEENFYLEIASHQSKLITGIVAAFALGMFWKRATAAGGLAAIIGGVVFSYAIPPLYGRFLAVHEPFASLFGPELNFLHRVAVAALLAFALHVIVSLLTQPDSGKARFMWTDLGGHEPKTLKLAVAAIGLSFVVYGLLATAVVLTWSPPVVAAVVGAGWTWAMFVLAAVGAIRRAGRSPASPVALVREDRLWAGALAATAVFLMFYYF